MNMNDRIQSFIERHSTDPGPEGTLERLRTEPNTQPESHTAANEPPALHPQSIDLGRHARKCSICHHPDRLAIEQGSFSGQGCNGVGDVRERRGPIFCIS